MEFVDPIYDKQDIVKMKKALKEEINGERNLLMFELALATAFRIQDILDLTVSDVKEGIVRKRTKKTGRMQEFRLNDRVFMLVRAFIDLKDDDELLFPIDRIQAYRIFKKAAEKVGIPNFGTHSCRKTKAYHMYMDSGRDIAIVMELLGHKDAESTLRYIGYKKERLSIMAAAHDL